MSGAGLSRRGFLSRSVLLFVGAAGLGSGCRGDRGLALARRLVGLLNPAEGLEEIGRTFLRESEPGTLRSLLASVRRDFAGLDADSPDRELVQRLISRIGDDFEAERTVQVQGWVLSLTEARLSALSVLLEDEEPAA